MTEAVDPIDPIITSMLLGQPPEPCVPILEVPREVLTRLLDVVEFGDQLKRAEKDRLIADVKNILTDEQPELWALYIVGPNLAIL
jgi:hypothetical protein